MSASGDAKQIGGISKDSASEITSKTDNGGDKTVTELKDKIKQKVTDANRTEAEFDKKDVTLASEVDSFVFKTDDPNVPSSAVEKSKQETDITNQTSEDQENEDITQESDMNNIEPTGYFPKIQADADKDSSSLGEDLELRWDEDDDEDETTTEVLKILDRELTNDSNDISKCNEDKKSIEKPDLAEESHINVVLKSDELKSIDSSKMMPENTDIDKSPDVKISSVNDSLDKDNNDIDSISSKDDKTHDNDDVEMVNTSLESEKILDQIDSLTKESVDVDMEKFDQSTTEITDKTPIPDVIMEDAKKTKNENDKILSSTSNILVELTNDHKKQPKLIEKECIVETFEKATKDIDKNMYDIDMQDIESDKVTDVEIEPANIENIDNNQVNTLTSLTIENVITEKVKPEIKDQAKTDTIVCEQPKMNEDTDKTFEENLDETSQADDSMLDAITPNVHHRINKPNVMLDIPTQELSDIEAELDDDFDGAIEDEDRNQDIIKDTLVEELSKNDVQIDVTIESVKEKASEIDQTDIDMKESKKSVAKAPIVLKDSSPTIEIDGTTSKLNITSISPKKTNDTSKLIHESTVSKSLEFNELKSSTSELEKDDSKSLNLEVDIDESNSGPITEEISNAQDTDIKKKSEQNAEDIEKTSTKTEFDGLETTLEIERIDEKPSILNLDESSLSPDLDSVQEVTDSLGLLAESSRVMDDDEDDADDAEDPEADDNEDDEDFDPYEETNSGMAEDMEDSTTPPPELDSKKPGVERESDEGTLDAAETTMMDIVDDIECVENELPEMELADDMTSEAPSIDGKDEPEIIDDTDKDAAKCPSEKIMNILEKVMKSGLTGAKSKDSTTVDSVRNYVELEGSSDSDDVQEVSKPVTSVKIPLGVEVMTSGPHTSEILSQEGGQVISGLPTPSPHKVSKINTSEVTIKTAGTSSPALHIPETTSTLPILHEEEIYNLIDSDDDENEEMDSIEKEDAKEDPKKPERKCINPECTSESRTYYRADRTTAAYYSLTRRSAAVCEECRNRASKRSEALIKGIKELHPLLDLDMDAPSQQLVEISDSESEGEGGDDTDALGETNASFLEEHLADMINETWTKYKMESRLHDTQTYIMSELDKIEAGAKEIDAMLDECQKKTDAIRLDFYKDYEPRRKPMGAIVIYDTPFSSYSHTEKDLEEQSVGNRYPKRRAATVTETPAKRPAIPLGYIDNKTPETGEHSKADDDKEDISVVKLSAEAAPADLPPCGEITRPPMKVGMTVYAMKNAYGTWHKGKIMDIQQKVPALPFTNCRVRFEHKAKASYKVLASRCIAYPEPTDVRLTIGTRVVALFKDPHNKRKRDTFYSGVVAEIPNPVNSYRYLVFFDDGYAQYVRHQDTRIVWESSTLVWEEVHPFIRDFICNYLLSFPERPMVRLHAGERLKTEWNGRWWDSKVLQVDASIALIHFYEDNRTEWIYRGSTRLMPLYLELKAAEKAGEGGSRSRLPRSKAPVRSNMPCVEYTRSDEQDTSKPTAETQAQQQHNEEMRRQRSVAKKSTSTLAQPPTAVQGTPFEGVISRVVYYTPKNAVKPYKMVAHTCTAQCRRSDLLSLRDLRTYNPLAKPLLSGWERQTVRYKGHKDVVYRAPCGRRLRNMHELHSYLRTIQSDLSVDLFDFTPGTHCLAEFVLHKCLVSKKDLSHGKENVPVPCVNYFDDTLPEFCSYNTERTPTAGVPLNLDPEFLCGCDCTDDCMDKTKCACWKMTLEGARTIGLEGPNVGYVYRRLPEPLPSGIYECNSRCKCKQTCLNRVAQHPLQLKLQVFKTVNRGWGIRALNDVPKGSFLCVYAGNLLTDATANLDGLNEGDEYLAELDYIEVVEAMKEGYEDDVPEADKKLDKKSSGSESEPSSSSEEEKEAADGDFQPGYIPHPTAPQFKKSLRKREKAKKKEEQKQIEEVKRNDCITISDDEEVREPSRFTAQAGIDKDLISKQSSRVSVRTLFGKDEACYIMDAKVQGNIGRYLNHSCHPNVFVQNVFVDTHDPRFPWVAFFALSHVRAGTELTWNYNYDVGSVPEKVLYCYCGAPNCRGRLL